MLTGLRTDLLGISAFYKVLVGLLEWTMHLFFVIQSPRLSITCTDDLECAANLDCVFISPVKISKLIILYFTF